MDKEFRLAKNYFDLGLNYFENSNFLEAEKYFKLSLSYSPGRASILTNLSATLIKLNKYQEAQDLITNILSTNPNDPVSDMNKLPDVAKMFAPPANCPFSTYDC